MQTLHAQFTWGRAWRVPLTAVTAALLVSACADPTTSATGERDEGTRPAFEVTTAAITTNTLNPSGGTNADDGLKIWTSNGAYQIQRGGLKQVYADISSPATMAFGLRTQDGMFSWEPSNTRFEMNWTNTMQQYRINESLTPIPFTVWTQSSNTLTETDPGKTWTNIEVLTATKNGRTYGMTVTTVYTLPEAVAKVTVAVALPAGLTVAPQLYLASDFYLDGNDNGPGATGLLGDGRRWVVQQGETAVGGVLEADHPFSSYYEGYYECVYGMPYTCGEATVPFGPGGDLAGPTKAYPNTVKTESDDAGVGAHWDLATTAAGTVTRSVYLYFAKDLPGDGGGDPETITVIADDKSVTFGSTAPTYTYTLEDGDGGAWSPPSGWIEPTCTATYTAGTTGVGTTPITCSGADADGFEFEYDNGTLEVTKAKAALTWTGATGLVNAGASITLSASLAPEACIEEGSITFTVNGKTATSPYVAPSDGGILEVVATFKPTGDNCSSATTTEVLVAAMPGGATTGGGHYRVSSNGNQRINFGHTVQKTETTNKKSGTTTTVYRGQLLWMVTERWRFKGSVYSSSTNGVGDAPAFVTFLCPSSPTVGAAGSNPKCGLITGTGVLQEWNGTGWTNVGGSRTFVATIYDGGSVKTCKGKSNCTTMLLDDFFGLALGEEVPAGVPVSAPQPLQSMRNGNIVIR